MLRSLRAAGESRLLVMARNPAEIEALPVWIAFLTARSHATFGRLGTEPSFSLQTVEPPHMSRPPAGPENRARWLAVNEIRGRRHNSEDTAGILETLAGGSGPPPVPGRLATFPPRDRENIAHMQGDVDLAEGGLTVHFEAGRLAGARLGDVDICPRLPALSWVRGAKGITAFETTAFSIEGNRTRGLRTVQSVPEGGRLLMDYVFVEDHPALLITGLLEYPSRDLEEIVPLEIPIGVVPPGGRLRVEAAYREGTRYAVIAPEHGVAWLAGSVFYVPGPGRLPGLVVGIPPGRGPIVDVIRLRSEPRSEGTTVYLGLCVTGPEEAGTAAGAVELFSFYLAAGESCPVGPELPRPVLQEIPRSFVELPSAL